MTKKLDIPFGRPWIEDADRDAVMRVLQGHILTHGPECKGFEDDFVAMMGGGYAASTSSCMAALHLAWLDLGVGPGDEVIVPAMTHVATVHAVALTGATPVFVDCDAETGNMSLDAIKAAATDKTKGIGIVHFVGIACDMPAIMAFADNAGLPVVEDCAIAIGSRINGTHVGLFGHVGCYSFYPVKHITTGEGGMLVSNNAETIARIAKFRAFSVDRTHQERKIPGIYDVLDVGMNYRMSEMAAALGRVQMTKVPVILEKRAANFDALKDGLSSIDSITVIDTDNAARTNSHYCLVASLHGSLADKRDDLVLALNALGVGTSIYYPHPVSRLTAYNKDSNYVAGTFPNAEQISDRSIALPVGPHLDIGDMDDIVTTLTDIVTDMA